MNSGKLILVRHGLSVYNDQNRFTGWKDVDLNEQGVAEAKQAVSLLEKIDWLVITSRTTCLLKNLIFLLLIKAPGNNSDSSKIWNPLQIPITGTPLLASLITDFIIGENLAIAPVLK